jgi:hypothetical protein
MAKKYPKFTRKNYYIQTIDPMGICGIVCSAIGESNDRAYAKHRARQYHKEYPGAIVRVWSSEEDRVIAIHGYAERPQDKYEVIELEYHGELGQGEWRLSDSDENDD